MMFGIPYAYIDVDDDGNEVAVCPVCFVRIPLVERKDFESMTGDEYARHYNAEHRKDES